MPYRLTHRQLAEIPVLWERLAQDYNGEFKHILAKSPAAVNPVYSEAMRFELSLPTEFNSNLSIMASEHHNLKVEYLFKRPIDFRLRIVPEDIFEKFAKIFGSQDVQIGILNFDSKYKVETDNSKRIKKLLNRSITENLIKINTHTLYISNENKPTLAIMPMIREEDEEMMRNAIDLSCRLIEEIERS